MDSIRLAIVGTMAMATALIAIYSDISPGDKAILCIIFLFASCSVAP